MSLCQSTHIKQKNVANIIPIAMQCRTNQRGVFIGVAPNYVAPPELLGLFDRDLRAEARGYPTSLLRAELLIDHHPTAAPRCSYRPDSDIPGNPKSGMLCHLKAIKFGDRHIRIATGDHDWPWRTRHRRSRRPTQDRTINPNDARFEFDVFLSHNHADKPKVRKLAERLKAAGVRVWIDEWVIQPETSSG